MISESILEGDRVRLRPVQEGDLPSFVKWLADREVTRWLAAIGDPPTAEEEQDWYFSMRENPDNVLWAIETLGRQLMGSVELRVTPRAERAELGIAIQDKSQWSKGYGTEAVRLVVAYAFDEMDLNRVELTCDETNERAIRCYEKCGFVREGLLRQHRLVAGKFGNTLVMGLLREDWRRARSRAARAAAGDDRA